MQICRVIWLIKISRKKDMPLASEQKLDDGTILGIWDISQPAERLPAAESLTAEEQEELLKRSYPQKKKQFLAARALLGHLLGERHPICYLSGGQPFIPGSELQVSVSHSGNYVAVAVSAGKPVGVDIEVMPRKSLAKAKSYFLNDDEQRQTEAGCSVEELHVYWSAKEALFKYAGNVQLNLKDHFSIAPFSLSTCGKLSARISGGAETGQAVLSYWLEQGYILVVTGA